MIIDILQNVLEMPRLVFDFYCDRLGLSQLERISLYLSVFTGLAGSLLDYVLKRAAWARHLPKEEKNPQTTRHWLGVMLARSFMGIVIAGLLWCLLGPDLSSTKAGALKVMFLCGVAGLAAPLIAESWRSRAVEWTDRDSK
jgi:hypothetical protein